MIELNSQEIKIVGGGMDLDDIPPSDNVEDQGYNPPCPFKRFVYKYTGYMM